VVNVILKKSRTSIYVTNMSSTYPHEKWNKDSSSGVYLKVPKPVKLDLEVPLFVKIFEFCLVTQSLQDDEYWRILRRTPFKLLNIWILLGEAMWKFENIFARSTHTAGEHVKTIARDSLQLCWIFEDYCARLPLIWWKCKEFPQGTLLNLVNVEDLPQGYSLFAGKVWRFIARGSSRR
jgi:hypothetical protein